MPIWFFTLYHNSEAFGSKENVVYSVVARGGVS